MQQLTPFLIATTFFTGLSLSRKTERLHLVEPLILLLNKMKTVLEPKN